MKRLLRWLAGVAAVVALLVAVGTLVPSPLFRSAEPAVAAGHRIVILANAIHTDIAVPLDDEVRGRFGFLWEDGLPSDERARYLLFGWGSRAFYLETPSWADARWRPIATALTVDASVMHVELVGDVADLTSAIGNYNLSDDDYRQLLSYIDTTFARSGGKPVLIPDAGYGQFDRFYEANGRFTAVLGCNTWTSGGLREAGLRTGLWNPLPFLLGVSLRLYN